MKSSSLSYLSLAVLVGAALCVPTAAAVQEDLRARGAKLFADPGLGTNGKSCSTCHSDGKGWAGKPRFPKFALGGERTLDQAIQTCTINALQGRPLAWDDEKLTSLAVFIDGLYAPPAK